MAGDREARYRVNNVEVDGRNYSREQIRDLQKQMDEKLRDIDRQRKDFEDIRRKLRDTLGGNPEN